MNENLEAFHDDVAHAKRLGQLYGTGPVTQAAVEGFVLFNRTVDRLNREADKLETERRTKLYNEKTKEISEVKKRDDQNPPAIGVTINPIRPVTPANSERYISPTEHLEMPLTKLGVKQYDLEKSYEVKNRTFEIPKKTYEVSRIVEFPTKGMTIE